MRGVMICITLAMDYYLYNTLLEKYNFPFLKFKESGKSGVYVITPDFNWRRRVHGCCLLAERTGT